MGYFLLFVHHGLEPRSLRFDVEKLIDKAPSSLGQSFEPNVDLLNLGVAQRHCFFPTIRHL